MSNDFATVVILSYNRAGFLKRTIESLKANTTYPIEIIVVDDGSNLETKEYIFELIRKKEISTAIMNCGVNMGIGVGLNRAFKMAKGAYVVKADADIEYFDSWLEEGVKIIQDTKVGMVGFFDYDHYDPNHKWHLGANFKKEQKDYIEVRDFVSSVFLMRKVDYDTFGDFAEKDKSFSEDVDYKQRLTGYGFKMAITKTDKVKNFGFGEIGSSLIKRKRLLPDGKFEILEYEKPISEPLIFQ